MIRVPNPNATEIIKWEDTEFEVSITLPIGFKNEIADRISLVNDMFTTKMHPIYRDIVKKGLIRADIEDENGIPMKWQGDVPDEYLNKFESFQITGLRAISLLTWLGQEIWRKNNIGFFRQEPTKVGNLDDKG